MRHLEAIWSILPGSHCEKHISQQIVSRSILVTSSRSRPSPHVGVCLTRIIVDVIGQVENDWQKDAAQYLRFLSLLAVINSRSSSRPHTIGFGEGVGGLHGGAGKL